MSPPTPKTLWKLRAYNWYFIQKVDKFLYWLYPFIEHVDSAPDWLCPNARSDWLPVSSLSTLITHHLIFARAHFSKHITWYKIGRRLSGDTRRPIRYPSSNFFDARKT